MNDERLSRVLTVAGLDCSGGAGIAADVEAITALGLHAAAVCTAVTAQSSAGVRDICPVPAASVTAQLEAVFEDFDVRAMKTGMLTSAEVVHAVARFLRRRLTPSGAELSFPLVVDPVMEATAGGQLLSEEGISALVAELLPLAHVVTPNLAEAARLAGMPVENTVHMKDAARKIRALGVRNVIVKGGHLPDKAVDIIYDGSRFEELSSRKQAGKAHGMGCTYSAALAAYLALGTPLHKAAAGAKHMATLRLDQASH
jgi:hydroxymethylpyrimidine kinase/phosphomethylpyrimidine kinase